MKAATASAVAGSSVRASADRSLRIDFPRGGPRRRSPRLCRRGQPHGSCPILFAALNLPVRCGGRHILCRGSFQGLRVGIKDGPLIVAAEFTVLDRESQGRLVAAGPGRSPGRDQVDVMQARLLEGRLLEYALVRLQVLILG